MKIKAVPVIIKAIDPKTKAVEVVNVLNLFPVLVTLTQFDEPLSDSLYIEARLAVMINSTLHLLTLLPEREDGQIIYHTHITKGATNDKTDTPGDDGPPKDAKDVSRPDNGSGEETSGGDAAPDSKEVHH